MDDEAFREVLRVQTPMLFRLARRLAPQAVDPQDLVQDVLERAWRSRERFRGDAQPATWLHRILVNRSADLARRATTVSVDPAELAESDLIDLQVDDPQAVIERAGDAASLRAALSQLAPLDRTVLVLHDGEEWPVGEIAEVCSTTTDAAQKRLQRARLRLARELGAATSGPPRCETVRACRDARQAVGRYLDETLDSSTAARVDAHLRACARCPPLVQALVGIREAVRSSPDPRLPEPLVAAVRRLGEG